MFYKLKQITGKGNKLKTGHENQTIKLKSDKKLGNT